MTEHKVLFNGQSTGLDLASVQRVLQYIKDKVIPNVLDVKAATDTVADVATVKTPLDTMEYVKITKNDSIERLVDKLKRIDVSGTAMCLYSYGPHIQKMLSIIEIYKKTVQSRKSEAGSATDNVEPIQWNKLLRFQVVSRGRNELLEKKIMVPIMITVIAPSSSTSALEAPRSQNLEGFTRQSVLNKR